MKSVKILLWITDELLKQLDKAAKANFTNRSDYIREAVVLRLRGSKIVSQQRDDFL